MKHEQLTQLIEETFSKLACPKQRAGLYAEIEKAVMAAYSIGKENSHIFQHQPEHLLNQLPVQTV